MKSQIEALLREYQSGLLSEAELRARYAQLVASGSDGAPARPADRAGATQTVRRRRVVLDGPGSIEDIRVVEDEVGAPEEHAIHVDTVAISLNFGDLLCVQGLYPTMPAYPFTPGFEASGIVRAVGSKVTRFAAGDEVIVSASVRLGIQSTLIVADESQLVAKPARLSFEEAASFLTVGLTIVEAFRRLRLAKGETILVQSATGGTGLVAVQLAQRAGATIIATASSDEKLRYLTAMGVPHVIDYVRRDFEAEVMAITKGKGVDAVINTLAGEAIQKGINCLSPRGRYVEIAMTGLKSARSIDLSRMSNNQSFHSLDLRKLLLDVPEHAADLGEELFSLVERGELRIVVGKTFDFDAIGDAYRYLADRRNIGKVVVTVPGPKTASVRREAPMRARPAARPADRAGARGEQPIAIVGMSGRFGAAKDIDELWRCVVEMRGLITQLPEGRKRLFQSLELPAAQRGVEMDPWGSYLDDIECFDPLFFSISGQEAQHMDPQQRIFLQESWKALEDAGLTLARLDGSRTGVVAGVVDGKYASYIEEDKVGHSFWGTAGSILPARIAYFLNLKGPAIAIDTACSSSLVAVHIGCQSLWSRETDVILAGGAFIQATPHFGVAAGRAQMLSADGKCFTFDDRANGMVSGEAVAVLVLERLDDAIANGDRIHGVIVGSGINQDGATNGITAPSAASQRQLELDVYNRFGIDPGVIQYVEAHGTGTKLGDPIEVRALTEAFQRFTDRRRFCAIGSVKPNVGHTVTVAGVTGVINVLLALRHRLLPGLLNYGIPNRHIDFENSPFYVNTSAVPWVVEGGKRRRAAVSSFGFSGTNAHVVIEEYVPPSRDGHGTADDGPSLLPISARTGDQLLQYVSDVLAHVNALSAAEADRTTRHERLADLAYTFQVGREAFEHRLAVIADDLESLASRLSDVVAGKERVEGCFRGKVKKAKAPERASGSDGGDGAVGAPGDALRRLAERWVEGYAVDWSSLHAGARRSKVSAPTYPFARDRYWSEATPRAASREEAGDRRARGAGPQRHAGERARVEMAPAEAATARRASVEAAVEGSGGGQALRLVPVWEPVEARAVGRVEAPRGAVWVVGGNEEQRALLGASWLPVAGGHEASVEQLVEQLGAGGEVGEVVWIAPRSRYTAIEGESVLEEQRAGVESCFRLVKALLARGYGSRELALTAVTVRAQAVRKGEEIDPTHASVHGLWGTVAKEYPRWKVRVADLEGERGAGWSEVLTLAPAGEGDAWANRGGEWFRQTLLPCEVSPSSGGGGYREGGVYVVIGGGGGIGEVLSEHLIRRYRAQVVWIGRRGATEELESKRKRLGELGPRPEYEQADAADREALEQAYARIKARHGAIHGVVHSAVGTFDKSVANTTPEQFAEVLRAKVDVSVRLAQVFGNEPLDFAMFFSSLNAFAKGAGKCGYSAGSTFEDAYAHQLGKSRPFAVKTMNWGWWGEVGSAGVVPQSYKNRIALAGIGVIDAEDAMSALEALLAGPFDQLGLTKTTGAQALGPSAPATDPARPEDRLPPAIAARGEPERLPAERARHGVEAEAAAPDEQLDESLLRAKSVAYLRALVSRTLRVNAALIDVTEPLERYGIDSILVMQLIDALKEAIPDVGSTLFFEHQTIDALADHLVSTHREAMRQLTGLTSSAAASAAEGPRAAHGAEGPAPPSLASARSAPRANGSPAAGPARDALDDRRIAIIGLSGRYPQARTVDEYWENLKAGKDSVVEIPPERWSLDGFYCDDVEEAVTRGKSYCRWGGFLDGFTEFDPLFFHISPLEAEGIDPQERLFMQASWDVLEDAGYTRESLARRHGGRVGVFAGITRGGFELHGPGLWQRGIAAFPRTSFSSVANRVSYFLNLHGPSMPVDTMCSSSLTAIHEACEHLLRDECELAIAGGVNLYVHPSSYVMLCLGRMLSPRGRCRSFGVDGDGMVPGEGVGTVLLKRLSRAEADGDHIYGVILGTSINHGGKTNGYTVPNPAAHKALILSALGKAGVDARAVSYVEAHGTGTELGDPIEIAGLTQAFRASTPDVQFCAIASAKSNIGHCEAAAGIAGLTKVLLQMKHGQIAPSLHVEELNPHIAFEKTPFVVQRRLGEWKRPTLSVGGRSVEAPRIAGISSFGAGGANAHVIVAEYVDERAALGRASAASPAPVAVVLSARTEAQLEARAAQLLAAVRSSEYGDAELPDIAYTLQVGREAMDHRLAFTAASVRELCGKLARFVAGGEPSEDIHRGEIKRAKDGISLFAEDEDLRRAVDAWIGKKKYARLLELWVRGLSIDWTRLHEGGAPRRVPLPTYPFARDRYWPAGGAMGAASALQASDGAVAALHPLLHRNTSDFAGQRFTSELTGSEFFLKEHVVQGRGVLPGAAYLEMVRAALELSSGDGAGDVALHDVAWLQPFTVVDGRSALHVSLDVPDEHGASRFEVYSEGEGGSEIVHCRGEAALVEKSAPQRLDLGELRARCAAGEVDGAGCYEAFDAAGIAYGAAFRVLRRAHLGAREALVELELPEEQRASSAFVIHPSVLDGALQGTACVSMGEPEGPGAAGSAPKAALLFSVRDVDVVRASAPRMWAWIRVSAASTERVRQFDIDVCDEEGVVCARLSGVSARVHDGAPARRASVEAAAEGSGGGQALRLVPVWEPVEARAVGRVEAPRGAVWVVGGNEEQRAQLGASWLPVAGGHEASVEQLVEQLGAGGEVGEVVWIAPRSRYTAIEGESVLEEQRVGVESCFRLVKALLARGYGSRELALTAVTVRAQAVRKGEEIDPTHASVHGLWGTVAKEYPRWKVRVADLEGEQGAGWSEVLTLAPAGEGDAWANRGGEWFRQTLLPCEVSPSSGGRGYREGGVYVVIGGGGGIGEVLSEHLIRRYRAQVVWIGRRGATEELESKRKRLGELGPRPEYEQADAADREALEQAYARIKARHGAIHGVVHSAVGTFDKSVANTTPEQFAEVLRAKVDVSVRLAQVFGNEPLDFAMFFSGMNSFSKDAGKCGYSAGGTFEDAYAHQLGKSRPFAVKTMNWGWWGEVGAAGVVPQSYKNRMALAGISAIGAEDAASALEALLAGPFDQLGLMKFEKLGLNKVARAGTSGSVEAETPWLVAPPPRDPSVIGAMSLREAPPPALDADRASRRMFEQLDEHLREILSIHLRDLGLLDEGGASLVEKSRAIGMPPLYDRWLRESLRLLRARGAARSDVDAAQAWRRWEQEKVAWSAEPNLRAQVRLVEATLRALPRILTGAIPATEVIFPRSSMALVEDVYKNNGPADYFNAALADQVLAFVDARIARDPAARIRIVEIGAGTGSASAHVFERLWSRREHVEVYRYTDLSKAFLFHAQEHYATRAPYLKCQIFDVERDPSEQSIEIGTYDVAIAANVLHATRNVRRTLRNVKAMLKPNGVLVLNEITSHALLVHLTFGLLEGWWRYEDDALRMPGTPGLSAQTWRRVLEDEGFRSVLFPTERAAEIGQQVIAAESDGIVRRPRPPEPMPAAQPLPAAQPPRSPARSGAEIAESRRARPTERAATPAVDATPPAAGGREQLLRERTVAHLLGLVGKALKIDVAQLDPAESLESYGIDSILVVQLTDALKEAIPDISSTLFFEHQTINALVDHLLRTKRDVLRRLTGVGDAAAAAPSTTAPASSVAAPPVRAGRRAGARVRPSVSRGGRVETAAAERAADDRRIAIIGLSGRYPQARTIDEYWENLKAGKDSVVEIPPERWAIEGFYCEDPRAAVEAGKSYCRWGGFLDGFAEFDPMFFNISPLEAEGIDPQERLFMQASWDVLEDAGYTRESLARRHGGRVGVFAGITKTGFDLYGPELWRRGAAAFPHTSFSSVANRVSYFLNIRGPSMPIDTMCSSSLTAIHEACEHLLRGECELAIAGGVNLYLHPSSYVLLCMAGMLSKQGRSRSFGRGADGMVPGEAVGAVLLKPLSRAEADGDPIYGVILGTSINHGGKTNGYLVPNPAAHRELILSALARAGVDARAVSYVEAHGTGTELGDPIEIAGLTQAFRASTPDVQFCAIASAKSNIGHCEAAAGIAGLTKVLLQMKHGQIAPSLHVDELNPHIAFEETPFVVQRRLGEWKRPTLTVGGRSVEAPRIAGISSFGAGGANAHVIVAEYAQAERRDRDANAPAAAPVLIALSAKSSDAVVERARDLVAAIRSRGLTDADLRDVAYTLQVGREAMDERLAVIVGSVADLEEKLRAFVAGSAAPGEVIRGRARLEKDALGVVAHDDDFEETIGKWIQRGKLRKLAELWVRGLDLDWERLYGERKPRRISLPAYPFARERHWLPLGEGAVTAAAPAVEASPEAAAVVEYEEVWERLGREERAAGEPGLRWLVVGGDEPWRASVVEALGRHEPGCEAIGVSVGGAFGWDGGARSAVPEASEAWFLSLFEEMERRDAARGSAGRALGVVYAWGRELERLQGVHGLLRGARGSGAPLRRLVLTGRVADGEVSGCYDASLIGVERSAAFALPELSVGVVLGGAEGVEADAVAREAWMAGVIRCEAAERYRLGVRRASSSGAAQAQLRDGGVYVITGGAGGLGQVFGEHLARRCAGRIALVGRRRRDERIEAQLGRLREAGATEAEYFEADVADAAQMSGAVAAIEARWGAIHGVLHAAGVESSGAVVDRSWEQVAAVARPKVEGTRVIDEVTARQPLDFMCLFSSTAAVLGDGGSCDYATANRFQVAYAQHREQLRRRGERSGATVAVCWPLWRDGGMGAVGSEGIEMYLRTSGQRYLERAEGLAAWERAMGAGVSPRLVLAGQPRRVHGFLSRIYAGTSAALRSPPSAEGGVGASIARREQRGASAAAAPLAAAAPGSAARSPATLRERVAAEVKARVEGALKLPAGRLDEDASFADIGLDSIGLAQLARLLTRHFGFEVMPNVFFSYSTIEKLAAHLVEQHRDAIEAAYQRADAPLAPAEPRQADDRRGAAIARAPLVNGAHHAARPDVPREGPRRLGARVSPSVQEPVAIIGMSVRAAGADDVDDLWELLLKGHKQIQEVPQERWDWRPYYSGPGATDNRIASNRGAFLRGLDHFDPLFFEISPREAEWMEPRQRLMLQEAWRAFEDAGYAGERLRGTDCGVFIGVEEALPAPDAAPGPATSAHNGILAARISYVLDLRGPNLALNTACSSGLVAVHTACQSLLHGECSMALAGGVNVLTSPATYVALTRSGMLSAEGECYAFDERASGMVPGEAVAAVVLKRLSQAVADGDPIHAVIRATGVNYDGRTNGITAPSGLSQQRLIESVLRRAEIGPERIQYVLGHSVGSALGDPIEAQALRDALDQRTEGRRPFALGSIKPVIGHTFAASGVVSLIAICLAMRHRQIPGTSNYRRPSEYIDLATCPFIISDVARPWTVSAAGERRCGMVGATGMSGTNVFAVVEEHEPERASAHAPGALGAAASGRAVIVLSARSDAALRSYARTLRARLASTPLSDLHDVAFTLQTGREAMPCRLALVASSVSAAIEKLDVYASASGDEGLQSRSIFTTGQERTIATADPSRAAELAEAWVRGAAVDWSQVHERAQSRRVSLPAYPFTAGGRSREAASGALDPILELIAGYSKRPIDAIDTARPLADLGIDSLLLMNMIGALEDRYSIHVSLEDVTSCASIAALCAMLRGKAGARAGAGTLPRRYKELEVLQSKGDLPPVFWFHGSLGTVQTYLGLSRGLGPTLPFYAVQSRGVKANEEPIDDLSEMAKYYAEILLAARGGAGAAFQLGGYSEGGLIAYEVTRHLQRMGHDVRSLVMIDTPYLHGGVHLLKDEDTRKLRYAMVYANILMINKLGGFTDIGALPLQGASAEDVLPLLVRHGLERGLPYSPDELRETIERFHRIAEANERAAESYEIADLPRPGAVECHYFQRRTAGVYFDPSRFAGAMVERTNDYFRDKGCAEAWMRRLPRFSLHLTSATDHFSLLSEADPFERIRDTCRRLYGVSAEGTKPFAGAAAGRASTSLSEEIS
ncbi:SDR family NAD(P)-dependent oxidoreductase [Sorangium cellulosum]|uniref:SDR family NAD(P)-dependent oxidoreductase n=1 Tax=Sorangium cellulosum TaxID=56 RepID=UPI0002DD629E|nr:SDR family NAD(P)-dependent oxidoreductase [Sorangium cellulosum]